MIYLDNSATTNPKPTTVKNAVNEAVRIYSFNSGRGGYRNSILTSRMIYQVREDIASFINCQPQNVAFTQNCTLALNMAIKGSVKKGDHVIISSFEHNAVSRTVQALKDKNIITYDIAPFSFNDGEFLHNIEKLVNSRTSLIVMTGASNVFGCALPVSKIGAFAKSKNIRFILDSAQTLGVFDTDMERDGIDILCAAGHKGLYGPMGTGFIAVREGIWLDTIIEGGTGSSSLDLTQPDFLPDRLESGTLNNSGIAGLGAGVRFVRTKGVDNIYRHEMKMIEYIYNEIDKNKNVTLYTPSPKYGKTAPILSFNYKDYPSETTAELLGKRGIAVRAGLHCAPVAHRFMNTEKRGTVRISPSVFTTQKECEVFINYLKKI